MPTPIPRGSPDRPLYVGGHWRLVNVGWPGGIIVVVYARAYYTVGTLGSRKADIIITSDGRAAGGRVLADKTWHEPEVLTERPARTTFMAILSFARAVSSKKPAFTVRLEGSIKVTDPVSPVAGSDLFCGITSTTVNNGPFYGIPVPENPNTINIFQDVTITTSSPGGSGTFSITNGPLSDVNRSEIGSGSSSHTGTASSAWYIDEFGNAVDTHEPCDTIPPTGTPRPPATKTEGWDQIEVTTFPRAHNNINVDTNSWLPGIPSFFLVTPKDEQAYGGFMMDAFVPRVVVGLNSDHLPIFDDLPTGSYDMRLHNLTFTQFDKQPIQKANSVNSWSLPGSYPETPLFARFAFQIGVKVPTPGAHRTLPIYNLNNPSTPAPFVPGVVPSSSQSFEA